MNTIICSKYKGSVKSGTELLFLVASDNKYDKIILYDDIDDLAWFDVANWLEVNYTGEVIIISNCPNARNKTKYKVNKKD